jgi:hypothetical protein
MPSSGGSVSDAPVNKVVNGQSHYLAYITPDEGKSLTDQGGKEVITDSGIPAYAPPGEKGGPGSGSEGRAPTGEGRGEYQSPSSSRQPGLETSTSVAKQTALQENIKSQQTETKDSLVTKVKNKIISKTDALDIASKLGWVTDNAFIDAIGGAWTLAMGMGSKVQKKAMTWGLENRIKSQMKNLDLDNPNSMNNPQIVDLQIDLQGVQDGTFTQKDYTKKYGSGDTGGGDGGDGDARGLTNIITPYAAHAIGGTTQQPSMAAQWYNNLGGSQGGFNLTTQYAAAKAIVAKRLGSTSAVGQLAVNKSAFYNFLKDNSLDKGIL